MARQLSELQSLPFHQIIGAPLLAIVQGQAQSSQATAEFIERVGFIPPAAGTNSEGLLGNIRMITFSYQKPDTNGDLKTFTMKVPLLSLLPIPSIEVKEAELDFNIKISDVQTTEVKSHVGDTNAESGDWYSKERVEFRATMGKMETSEGRSVDIQMKVKMKIERADIPAGLQHLFRVMEQAISSGENSTS